MGGDALAKENGIAEEIERYLLQLSHQRMPRVSQNVVMPN
jgi:hypothetical protein